MLAYDDASIEASPVVLRTLEDALATSLLTLKRMSYRLNRYRLSTNQQPPTRFHSDRSRALSR